jgi:hypothetical protein
VGGAVQRASSLWRSGTVACSVGAALKITTRSGRWEKC